MLIYETDNQLAAICAAARRQVRYEDRGRYLELIASELAHGVIGDGSVSRAIAPAVWTIRRNPEARQ